jgi:hypothetical protein
VPAIAKHYAGKVAGRVTGVSDDKLDAALDAYEERDERGEQQAPA